MGLQPQTHTETQSRRQSAEVCRQNCPWTRLRVGAATSGRGQPTQATMAEVLSCYCGACTLTITGEPAMQVYCHCSDCRKWGGSIAQVIRLSARDGVPSA